MRQKNKASTKGNKPKNKANPKVGSVNLPPLPISPNSTSKVLLLEGAQDFHLQKILLALLQLLIALQLLITPCIIKKFEKVQRRNGLCTASQIVGISTTIESVAELRESATNQGRRVRRKVEFNDKIPVDNELRFDDECNDDEDSDKSSFLREIYIKMMRMTSRNF